MVNFEFFVEFKEDWNKRELVDWDTNFYIASKYPTKHGIWWPVLSRGYFISALSPLEDLLELLDITREYSPKEIMLDLEIPFRIEFKNIKEKKKILERVIDEVPHVISHEYPYVNDLTERMKDRYGLKIEADEKIYMCYAPFSPKLLSKIFANSYKRDVKIGVGPISKGIFGFEMILKPKTFEKQIEEIVNYGNDIVIYRLGGLNERYLKVIKKYLEF